MKKNPSNPSIVCIGGGTGTFVVLKGLKQLPVNLTAIVSMADSGGSNRRIRDEFGLLPTSDIRQCFVALSDENGGAGLLRKLFMYRFEKGEGISGMTFANLYMAALADILGSQAEAIKQTGKVLRIHGRVVPVSYDTMNLLATYENGHIASEEHLIDEPEHDGALRITDIVLKPKANANPAALESIKNADLIVLGPGDLYTSVIPNLLVTGIAHAIQNTKAKKVYIVNLMTKWGQTYNFTAMDHITILNEYLNNSLSAVLINNAKIPQSALTIYAKQHEYPVKDDLQNIRNFEVIRGDFVSSKLVGKSDSDQLVRSLIRHDSEKLAQTLVQLVQE